MSQPVAISLPHPRNFCSSSAQEPHSESQALQIWFSKLPHSSLKPCPKVSRQDTHDKAWLSVKPLAHLSRLLRYPSQELKSGGWSKARPPLRTAFTGQDELDSTNEPSLQILKAMLVALAEVREPRAESQEDAGAELHYFRF